MSKKPKEPDEMRMPARDFDQLIRQALQAAPLSNGEVNARTKSAVAKRKKSSKST